MKKIITVVLASRKNSFAKI